MSRYNLTAPLPGPPGTADQPKVEGISPQRDKESTVIAVPDAAAHRTQHVQEENPSHEPAEDPHLALTSQTLNADGTPKRPMNAFMIFARKRRPQISAANQMMRTGDISKILSKEWTTMDMSEKKFYLDQAKKLKDNFNANYPNYVYRRRPNNSRKKRKPESEQGAVDPTQADTDDASLEEQSPVESDDISMHANTQDFPYTAPHVAPAGYASHEVFDLPQSPPHSFSAADFSTGHYGQHPSRPSHMQPPLDSAMPANPSFRTSPTRDSSGGVQGYNPHSAFSGHSQPSSMYSGPASQGLWDAGRDLGRSGPVRSSSSNWPVLPALDINLAHQNLTNPANKSSARAEAFSPPQNRPWSSASTSSGSNASGSHYNSPFPTLASPFFPSESPAQRAADMAASSPSHMGPTHEFFHSSSHSPRGASSAARHGGAREQGGFSQSPTLSGSSYPSVQGHPQWQPPYPGMSSVQRNQSLSNFPLPSPSGAYSPSDTTSGSSATSHMAYWSDRGRQGGR